MKYYIDCVFEPEKNELKYQIISDRGKEMGSVCYGRDHIIENKSFRFRILEWLQAKKCRSDFSVYFRNVLNETERDLVHTAFPYIPCYRNLWDFLYSYEQHNPTVDYDQFEVWKKYGETVLQEDSETFDGVWKCVGAGNKAAGLCCKWEDTSGKHVVIANELMFYSDVSFEELCRKEICFERCSASALQQFMKGHPESMLDQYLNHGGRRIFYFLTSTRNDHPFELLAKAGLSELADHLCEYRGVSKNGKTIREILQLPVRCLRAFGANNDMMLYEKEDRQVIRWAYDKCPDLFDQSFSVIQELWFRYCYQYRDLEISDGVKLEDMMRQSTRYLMRQTEKNGNPYQVFGLYENYLRFSLRIGSFFYGRYPKNLDKAVDACVEYMQKQYEELKAQAFVQAVESESYRALEEDMEEEAYRIGAPKSAEQLVEAGIVLCNCLKNYVSKVKRRQTMIGLIYEKEQNTLVGAIEVKGGMVIQAKGPFNGRLKPPVEEYLRRYMYRKKMV